MSLFLSGPWLRHELREMYNTMANAIHVLIVIDNLGTGGAQEFVYQLYGRLARDTFECTVCALRSGGVYREKIEALGIPVYVLAPNRSLFSLPAAIINLWRLLRSGRYDVVNILLQGSFAITTPLARLERIATVHSIMAARAQLRRWYFSLISWYQRWVDLYVTPIPKELTEAGVQEHKIKLVEVTVDLTEMLKVQHDAQLVIEPFDLTDAYPVALSIGRLHPDKGHEFAIRAWPLVLNEWPRARLLIVGDGDDEPRLKALAGRLGLSDSVIFAGYRPNLADLFARADVFLRTSVNEGVNLTTIQAMAAGLPTIGFKNPAPKEIINQGVNGIIVPLGDEVALGHAILSLSSDKDLMHRLGRTGRVKVTDYYDINHVVCFYANLYAALCKNQPIDSIPNMGSSIYLFNDHFSKDDRVLTDIDDRYI
jgi:glycosyltransferase involved in cell wall biosynthesis